VEVIGSNPIAPTITYERLTSSDSRPAPDSVGCRSGRVFPELSSAFQLKIAMNLDDKQTESLMEYREFLAPAPLAAHFRCFWTQAIVGSRGVYEHRVLPDGCIDIVLVDDQPP